jgi:hypothetical protein
MFDNSKEMEWFLVVILIGTIYFAFDTNFILGIVVFIINLIFVHQKDWGSAQTTIGKFFNKHIQRRWW